MGGQASKDGEEGGPQQVLGRMGGCCRACARAGAAGNNHAEGRVRDALFRGVKRRGEKLQTSAGVSWRPGRLRPGRLHKQRPRAAPASAVADAEALLAVPPHWRLARAARAQVFGCCETRGKAPHLQT
jgi:hypothetical protein